MSCGDSIVGLVQSIETMQKRIMLWHALGTAQDNLIAWYESEMDRSCQAEADLPPELVELERVVTEARECLRKLDHGIS